MTFGGVMYRAKSKVSVSKILEEWDDKYSPAYKREVVVVK